MPPARSTDDVVLFDLDGVLVDSRAAIHHSVQAAVDELGLGWTLDYTTDVLPIIGPPMAQSLGELLVRHGGDAARAPDLLAAYRRRYAAVMVSDSSLYDGIADALDALQGSWRLLVATSKPARFAQPLLEGLGVGDAFEAVFGPGADGDLESKGGTIARALQYAGGGSAVMIGDTAFDAVGAAENGIPCIGALWGFGTAEELSAAGAAPLISRPGEIAGAVEAAIARGGLGGLGGLGG